MDGCDVVIEIRKAPRCLLRFGIGEEAVGLLVPASLVLIPGHLEWMDDHRYFVNALELWGALTARGLESSRRFYQSFPWDLKNVQMLSFAASEVREVPERTLVEVAREKKLAIA